MLRLILATIFGLVVMGSAQVQAQVVPPPISQGGNQVVELDDLLINGLRATLPEQRAFLKLVAGKVESGKLEKKLVLAVMRYAQRRHHKLPFPFYERAIRYQAAKVGVILPSSFVIRSSSGQ